MDELIRELNSISNDELHILVQKILQEMEIKVYS